jgi:hypothetical protein
LQTRQPLRKAALSGKPVILSRTGAVGCYLADIQ